MLTRRFWGHLWICIVRGVDLKKMILLNWMEKDEMEITWNIDDDHYSAWISWTSSINIFYFENFVLFCVCLEISYLMACLYNFFEQWSWSLSFCIELWHQKWSAILSYIFSVKFYVARMVDIYYQLDYYVFISCYHNFILALLFFDNIWTISNIKTDLMACVQ